MVNPFITFYTPTYRRPQGLARCLQSVQEQTAVALIEQIVIPDHCGVGGDDGVGKMFSRIPQYVDAIHGQYVHVLCDDDVLAAPDVVEKVRVFAEMEGHPEMILVDATKGSSRWPMTPAWPPRNVSNIDLGCGIVRPDIWKRHVAAYSSFYDGDFRFYKALHAAGVEAVAYPILLTGAVSHGAAEDAA